MAQSQAVIVATLQGQTLRVPPIGDSLSSWPAAQTNPLYPHIDAVTNSAIEQVAETQPQIARRLKDNLGLLACEWYPLAEKERMEVIALFTTWIVCWDDCGDANEGELAVNLEAAERWRQRTLDVARRSLLGAEAGLDGEGETDTATPNGADKLEGMLVEFATRMAQGASPSLRRHFLEELGEFLRGCAAEQRLKVEKVVPDYDTYTDLRLGTVGGGILCAMVEYSTGRELPEELRRSEEAIRMRRAIGTCLFLLNDLLSLKKELQTDCVINAVSALLKPLMTLDEAVQEVMRKFDAAVRDYDDASAQLLKRTKGQKDDVDEDGTHDAVRKYVEGCTAIVTGGLDFT